MNNELKCNNFKFNSPRKSNFKFQQLLATIHIAQTSLLIIPYYVYFLHIYFLSQKKHQKRPLPYLINNKLTFFNPPPSLSQEAVNIFPRYFFITVSLNAPSLQLVKSEYRESAFSSSRESAF